MNFLQNRETIPATAKVGHDGWTHPTPHKRKNNSMKLTEKLRKLSCSGLVLVLALGLCGCAGTKPLKPAFYAAGVSLALSSTLQNSPVLTDQMRGLQLRACATVAGTNLAPATLAAVASNQPINSETLAIYNIIMGIYNIVFAALPDTSQEALRPYAVAIFCDGMAAGLASVPQPTLLKSSRKVKKGETVTTATLGDPQCPFATMSRPPLP